MSFISLADHFQTHTVTMCYHSETNTSQQLHKLHALNNVPPHSSQISGVHS